MTSWYWYVARDDELMIDCDGRTLLEIAIKKIERTRVINERALDIQAVFAAPSSKEDHWHLVIRLGKPLDVLERMVWQLYFMDHVYRSVKNLFRALDGIPSPSLLISPEKWNLRKIGDEISPLIREHAQSFWRAPDAVCSCPIANHKNQDLMKKCPAHIKLRGKL